MAVVFDSAAANTADNTTSVSFNLTVGSGSNRAVGISASWSDSSITGISVTVGGNAASVIIDSENALAYRIALYAIAAPVTGVNAVVISWTGNSYCVAGAIAVSGCDQTTPMNNGTGNSYFADSTADLPITSTNGDLTMSAIVDGSGPHPTSTDQIEKWNLEATGPAVGGAGDIGPGTGTTTHTWTLSGSHNSIMVGGNFVQAAGGGGLGRLILTRPA